MCDTGHTTRPFENYRRTPFEGLDSRDSNPNDQAQNLAGYRYLRIHPAAESRTRHPLSGALGQSQLAGVPELWRAPAARP